MTRAERIAERVRDMAEPDDGNLSEWAKGYNHAVLHGVPRVVLRGGLDSALGPPCACARKGHMCCGTGHAWECVRCGDTERLCVECGKELEAEFGDE